MNDLANAVPLRRGNPPRYNLRAVMSSDAPTPDSPTIGGPSTVHAALVTPPPGSGGTASPGPSFHSRAASRYAVEDEIGRGGMGIVYRAFDRDLRRPVAMKVLLERASAAR